MAKQLLENELSVDLPAYFGNPHSSNRGLSHQARGRFLVTKRQTITLHDIHTDAPVDGVPVDILGKVGSYQLAVFLAHKGRPVPESLRECANPSCGIIAIWLDRTRIIFRESLQRDRNYRTELIDFLEHDLDSKEWVYHPRYRQAAQKAEQATVAVRRTMPRRSPAPKFVHDEEVPIILREPASAKTSVLFECIICKVTWTGIEESTSVCPKCETHLYRRVKQRIDDAT